MTIGGACTRSTPADSSAPGSVDHGAREDGLALGGVRFIGRVDHSQAGRSQYAWSGSGFEARFKGRSISARLEDPGGNRHAVSIDGTLTGIIKTAAATSSYLLAKGLGDGEHVVRLHRITEAFLGPTTFLGLDVENGSLLSPPSARTRRLEIIGDSISCGYGNEGQDPKCGFSPDTENHHLSYGALAAKTLDAEAMTVAWSGKGVVKNYNGEPGECMPELYDRVLPQDPTSRWTFAIQPHAVIINLGTNDFSTEPDPSLESFTSAYAGFLKRIRDKYPTTHIVCTIGPMLQGKDLAKARKGIADAVERRVQTGDARVAAYEMKTTNENPGCDWHPGLETHARMAEELVRELRPRLGW